MLFFSSPPGQQNMSNKQLLSTYRHMADRSLLRRGLAVVHGLVLVHPFVLLLGRGRIHRFAGRRRPVARLAVRVRMLEVERSTVLRFAIGSIEFRCVRHASAFGRLLLMLLLRWCRGQLDCVDTRQRCCRRAGVAGGVVVAVARDVGRRVNIGCRRLSTEKAVMVVGVAAAIANATAATADAVAGIAVAIGHIGCDGHRCIGRNAHRALLRRRLLLWHDSLFADTDCVVRIGDGRCVVVSIAR